MSEGADRLQSMRLEVGRLADERSADIVPEVVRRMMAETIKAIKYEVGNNRLSANLTDYGAHLAEYLRFKAIASGHRKKHRFFWRSIELSHYEDSAQWFEKQAASERREAEAALEKL